MRSLRSTEALVALEDDSPDVLFETVRGTDLNIWPLIRTSLGQQSADNELETKSVPSTFTRSAAAKGLLRHWLWPAQYAPRKAPRQRNALFVAKGGTLKQTAAGRQNWLIDEFAKSLGDDTVVLQDRSINPRSKSEKPVFNETYSLFDSAQSSYLKAKLLPAPQAAIDSAMLVVDEIIAHFEFPVTNATKTHLKVGVANKIRRAPHLEHGYRKVLDRIQPKFVVMDSVSYLNRPTLTRLLRERGIQILEPQHGWIGSAHRAYNFGQAMFQPELKRYLPDQLMTFGEFWSDEIRHPSAMVPIGKPHLEQSVSSRDSHIDGPSLLIVSSPYQRDELIDLAVALRDQMPTSWRVLLRPHPSERETADVLYGALARQDRIELDRTTDVYESLATTHAALGHSSTVLYEALAFGVPALVIDSPLADLYAADEIFGERVKVGETALTEITSRILSDSSALVSTELLERIWKPHAVENFQQLVDSL